MNKPQTLRLITIITPVLCVGLVLLGIFFQVQHLRRVRVDQELTRKQLDDLNRMLASMQTMPQSSKMPTAPNTPDEQSAFLNMLRGFANARRVEIVHLERKPTPSTFTNTGAVNGTGSTDPNATKKIPDGVAAIFNDVEFAGNYGAVRDVMYDLLRAPRLYNTTDLKWTTDDKYPTTHLKFSLIRYVAVPAISPAPGSGASPATPAS